MALTGAERDAAARALGAPASVFNGKGGLGNWLISKYGTKVIEDIPQYKALSGQQADNANGVQTLNVASLNPYQQQALYGMGQQSTEVNPNIAGSLSLAQKATTAAGKPYDVNSYQQYMNPYIQEVIDRNTADINRVYSGRENDINQAFAEAGGFGSTAQGTERAANTESQAREVGGMSAALRSAGFDTATNNAMNRFDAENAANINQAGQYLNQSSAYQNLDSYTQQKIKDAIAGKLAAGNQIQGQNQAQLDAYYADKNAATAFPQQKISTLAQNLGTLPGGSTTTQTTPGVSTAQSALGGATAGFALNKYLPQNFFGSSDIKNTATDLFKQANKSTTPIYWG